MDTHGDGDGGGGGDDDGEVAIKPKKTNKRTERKHYTANKTKAFELSRRVRLPDERESAHTPGGVAGGDVLRNPPHYCPATEFYVLSRMHASTAQDQDHDHACMPPK